MHTPRESREGAQTSSIVSSRGNSDGDVESDPECEATDKPNGNVEDAADDTISPAPVSGTDDKVETTGLFDCTSNDTTSQKAFIKKSSNGPTTNPDGAETPTIDTFYRPDPYDFGRHRRDNVSKKQMAIEHPTGNKKKLKKFYTRQNDLIDQFLGAEDEERQQIAEDARMGPKIKFAVNASFTVNFCLFVIQLYAAVSTGSLSVESGRALGEGHRASEELHIVPVIIVGVAIFAKGSLMVYCFAYRKYPSVHVFFIDHRNDIAVNSFGLIMSVVGDRFVWYLDPIGAICIALLILFSWVSNAFDQVWLLVGKSAPREFVAKLVYMSMTHDTRILKVDTVSASLPSVAEAISDREQCRAYHAGQRYYVEIDIVMDETTPLRVSHDVSQELQRKVEGLADVERAFVHVDWEDQHCVATEHKSPFPEKEKKTKQTLRDVLQWTKKDKARVTETEIPGGRDSK
ncbi:Metal tolerance protein 10 [Colletotrichum chlorophyti]|uniref:Metal tolerance protein 10 n=1 Tax=Colletotrichum chlorophyti TaxID=708187 RepID=A0A1Q8RLW3_9PEZI|nr:Metal tolerance protein 10 [Colletotrichum chlorophyti]